MIRISILSLAILVAAPCAAQSWSGPLIAGNPQPLPTATPSPLPRAAQAPRGHYGRPYYPYRRGVYVSGLGQVTVWAGTPPPGLRRAVPRQAAPNPCAAGFGGAASADAAIGAAASVDGRRC